MLVQLDPTCHLSVLKWKFGESVATGTARTPNGRLVVLFEMPPAGDFDHEKQRPLSPTEHIRIFGRRLKQRWGRPAFVDALAIDDELHRQGLASHPLTELIERARHAHAVALPVTSLGRSDDYQKAVRKFAEASTRLPICLRITSAQFDSATFGSDLFALLAELKCEPERVFFVADFKDHSALTEEMVEDFSTLLRERINDLPLLHRWAGLAVAITSFPSILKLRAGDLGIFARTDLAVYAKLLANRRELSRIPIFGDYALDSSPVRKPPRVIPSAHLRYSTRTEYVVSKGTTVKRPHGYEAIYPVAERLTASSHFAGPGFSDGDKFIEQLGKRASTPGHAGKWRWASTDHHLTMNFEVINAHFDIVETVPTTPTTVQGTLFDLPSPPTVPAKVLDAVSAGVHKKE